MNGPLNKHQFLNFKRVLVHTGLVARIQLLLIICALSYCGPVNFDKAVTLTVSLVAVIKSSRVQLLWHAEYGVRWAIKFGSELWNISASPIVAQGAPGLHGK